MVDDLLKNLMGFLNKNGRICPQPKKWNELWKMLPDRKQKGNGWEPSLPLILAAWWEASDEQKAERLKSHVQWAFEHGKLLQIDSYLRNLSDNDWHYAGE